MTTIVVSGSTTSTVSTHVPSGTSYIVSAGGTLDVVSGGIVVAVPAVGAGAIEINDAQLVFRYAEDLRKVRAHTVGPL